MTADGSDVSLIRVFPRRTKWTPTDDMAFVGDPPMIRPRADEVHVSVTFTWDRAEAERLQKAWSQYYPVVRLGGPALDDPGGEFVAGRYIKAGVTITSRGCPFRCPWCFVWRREGGIRELPIVDGWIVQRCATSFGGPVIPGDIEQRARAALSGEYKAMSMEVAELLEEAVCTDGGHHKQWYLEKIARVLGVELPDHINGIAP